MHWWHTARRTVERWPLSARDGALALVLAAVELNMLWLVDPAQVDFPGFTGPTPAGVAVVLATTLPLTLRRRWPEWVLSAVGLTAIAAIPLAVPLQGWGLLVGLYTVAAYADRVTSYVCLGLFAIGTAIALVLADALAWAPVNVLVFATAWILGDRMKARRQHAEALEERALQLEREREDRSRLAVADERARIARELHNVLAHSVSVMVVQAGAARRTLAADPERRTGADRGGDDRASQPGGVAAAARPAAGGRRAGLRAAAGPG